MSPAGERMVAPVCDSFVGQNANGMKLQNGAKNFEARSHTDKRFSIFATTLLT